MITNLQNAHDFAATRTLIAEYVEIEGGSLYYWVLPATQTSDAAVAGILEANPPRRYFEPRHFDEHLSEASKLLDFALSKQEEIHNLEERAITSLLDYSLSAQLQAGNLALAKVALQAARNQAMGGIAAPDDATLENQDRLQSTARMIRLKMHNAGGHALNFGERIIHLRSLYADNVRLCFERLEAAKMGLSNAGIVTGDVPRWDGDSSANMMNLVAWVRIAISKLEEAQAREKVHTRVLFLGKDRLVLGGAEGLKQAIAAGGDVVLNFALQPGLFPDPATTRVLKLGLALVFDENMEDFQTALTNDAARANFGIIDAWHRTLRRQFIFSASVSLPGQRTNVGETISFPALTLEFDRELSSWNGLETLSYSPVQSQQAINATPVGNWQLTLKGNYLAPNGSISPVSALREGINNALFRIADVVLFMRVAHW